MDSAGGSTLLIEKDAILERWTKHLSSVLNRLSTIKEMPQIENVLHGEFQLSLKQCTHFNICHLAIPLAQMRHLSKCAKLEELTMSRKLTDLIN